ncbi:GH22238 [Drosophila grimshawi]|uniref:GH22238 n=1 Tax=Drosophila grimshawi TaxID=7222 RepID=B4K0Z4_DROGR|nr:GH22238 [Drosophila grimshawi]
MKTPKNKSKKSNADIKQQDKAVDVSEESKTVKKKPKVKKTKATTDTIKKAAVAEAKTSPKNLTAADLAKIKKKKAKKQAQKLKKKENKLASKTTATVEIESEKVKSEPKAVVTSNKEQKTPAKEKKPSKTNPKKEKKLKAKANRKTNDKDEDEVKRERDPAAEAATIFIGNLPINTKRVQLVRLLQPFGTVNSIRLRTAGGKHLFKHKQRKEAGSLNAYVVLNSAQVAEKALALNGTEFKENHLRVTPAAKAGTTAGNDLSSASSAPSDADNKRTIFVGNLKYSANEEKLREIFSSCGEIDYIRCLHDGERGCKGVAYVCFQQPDAVGLALELNETMLDERPIHVERYAVKKLENAKFERCPEAHRQETK